MRKGRLLWRVYLYFLVATLAALAVTTWFAVRSLRQFHEGQVADELLVRAKFIARELDKKAIDGDADTIDRNCKELGALVGTRVTVIKPDGLVIGDSDRDPHRMDNHANRPEITAAFRGDTGESERLSDTLKRTLKYVAIPVESDGTIVAVVRVSRPLTEILWTRSIISRQLLLGGMATAVLFAAVALYLSRRITHPLEEMRRTAQRLADGDLDSRVAVVTNDELGALAGTLNQMASQLSDRMDTIVRQQVEQHAVLTSMMEGVLAVSPEGSILYVNDAAAQLLDIKKDKSKGRSVQESVRHHGLQQFIMATLTDSESSEAEITVMRGIDDRQVQLHGAPLTDPGGLRMGSLIVMNDITRLKRLETVRRDFVANVSHELKTPLTALKGCVETLTSETPPAPEDQSRFMAMMTRQIGRLEAILEDLLSLSRIEFEVDQGQVERISTPVGDIVRRVVTSLERRAKAKDIELVVDCPGSISARVNAALLEQAIGNLVDNAVKYSGEKTLVRVSVEQEADGIAIRVEDQGPGIAKEHLPRIFERFYRVDRARSRELGGTGLGLSIVKHIVLAHHGNVTVDSTLGRGTTFTLHMPRD